MAINPTTGQDDDQNKQAARQALLGGAPTPTLTKAPAPSPAPGWNGAPPPTPTTADNSGYTITKTPDGRIVTSGTPPDHSEGSPTRATFDPTSGGEAPLNGAAAQAGKYASTLAPVSSETGLTPQGTLDQATAQAFRADLVKQYENYDNRTAPNVTSPQVGPAAQANPNAGAVVAPGAVTAGTVTAPNTGPAAQVGAVQVGPAALVTAPTLARTGPASAATAGAATVDRTLDEQLRNRQLGALDLLNGAATGTAPSAAQMQLQQGTDAAIASQKALAAGVTGTGRVTANLTAAQKIADLTQQGAADAAKMRAQEMAQARQDLVSGLQGARGQDIGVETTNAGNQQQASLQNAQQKTQVALANMTAAEAANAKQADLIAAAQTGNQNALNQLTQVKAQLQLQAAQGDQQAINDLQKVQATLDLQAAQGNQTSALDAAKATASNLLSANTASANNATSIAQSNVAQQNDLAKAQALMQSTTNQQNLDADLKMAGYDDSERQAIMNAAVTGNTSLLSTDVQNRLADTARDSQRSELTKTIIGGLFGLGGAILGSVAGGAAGGGGATAGSDYRMKKNVRYYSDERKKLVDDYTSAKGDAHPADDLLERLHPVSYEYKDRADDQGARPGQRFGIIAQDLEESPMGASVVVDTPKGKAVHVPQAVGVLLAAMARMHQRVKKVEGRR